MPGLSAHGLRKATATRLAAIALRPRVGRVDPGNRSAAVVRIYTRRADQKLLAREAMRRLIEAGK